MSTKLVYLHIPKSAGTSHRTYLSQIYGEKNIFWYGLHSEAQKFDAGEIGDLPVVGGHRQLDFYPRDLDALYTAVVRDPVEGVVSFFNYCTAPLEGANPKWKAEHEKWLEKWRQEKGMNHDSLSRSLRDCKAFRKQVTNYQCRYLSRHGATFKGVMKTLNNENMVIGLFDRMPNFNWFFTAELLFDETNTVQTNKGREGYAKAILEEPGLVDVIKELSTEDQALYDYISSECGGLYAKANNIVSARTQVLALSKGSNFDKPVDKFDWALVHLYCKGIVGISGRDNVKVPLLVNNGSPHRIVFAETENRVCTIGWQFLNKEARDIAGANGKSKLQLIVPPGQIQQLHVEIVLDPATLRDEVPAFVEFSIVDNDNWVRTKFPLGSAWAILA